MSTEVVVVTARHQKFQGPSALADAEATGQLPGLVPCKNSIHSTGLVRPEHSVVTLDMNRTNTNTNTNTLHAISLAGLTT